MDNNNFNNNGKSEKRRGFLALAGALSLGAMLRPFTSKAAKAASIKNINDENKLLTVKIHPSAVKRNTKGKSL